MARRHGAYAAAVPGSRGPRARLPMTADAAEVARRARFPQCPARRPRSRAPGEAGDRRALRCALGAAAGAASEGRSAVSLGPAPVLARARLDGGRAAAFRGDRSSPRRRAEQPHRLPRPARKRAAARGGAAPHAGWWERDYATGHVSLSDGACRIFGVKPVDLPHWDGRWRSLIHPEDRDKRPRRAKWRSPAVRATTWNTGW